ncbi:MAG TPA: hypothetical protein VGE62_03600 [Candidatus Paceibacterota bacterium]
MSKTTRIFILSLLVSLASVAGYAYGTSYVSGLSEKTRAAKSDVELAEIKYRHILSLEKAAQNTNSETSQINEFLIQPNAAIGFVTKIESDAADLGLSYNTDSIEVRNTEALSAQGKELVVVSFTASGRWASVFKMIKSVENLPYAVKFDKIDLVMLGDSNPAQAVSATGTTPSVREKNWKASMIFTAVKMQDK